MANPSFEDTIHCPINFAQIEYALNWFSPLTPLSTTDCFNACSYPSVQSTDVPLNAAGFQYAKTGVAYAGFRPYQIGPQKEYLEGRLSQTLEANKIYCTEFYYSVAENLSQYFIPSTISIYFSTDSVLSDTNLFIPVVPQVSGLTINDTANWVKISGTFSAVGGEKFITIGNFEPSILEDGVVYVYIDDVSVYLCDDTLPKPPPEIKIPNVFSPNNDEWNNEFVIENLSEGASVQIYNRWGELVAEWNTPNGSWDGRTKGGAESTAGVYYCIVKLVNGELKSGFVQLIR